MTSSTSRDKICAMNEKSCFLTERENELKIKKLAKKIDYLHSQKLHDACGDVLPIWDIFLRITNIANHNNSINSDFRHLGRHFS